MNTQDTCCNGNCEQGRKCPARLSQPILSAGASDASDLRNTLKVIPLCYPWGTGRKLVRDGRSLNWVSVRESTGSRTCLAEMTQNMVNSAIAAATALASPSPIEQAAPAPAVPVMTDAERYVAMKENDFTAEYCRYIDDCLNERERFDLDAMIDRAILTQTSPASGADSGGE